MSAPGSPSSPGPLYFEELQVGQRFKTSTYTVTEAQIRDFAQQFDPQPFHVDPVAAGSFLFGGLVASGWHTAAITMRLLVDSAPGMAPGTVGLGAQIEWPLPVRPGDCLQVESEVIEVTASRSRPERGRVTTRNVTRNAQGAIVQVAVARMLVRRRPQGHSPASPPPPA